MCVRCNGTNFTYAYTTFRCGIFLWWNWIDGRSKSMPNGITITFILFANNDKINGKPNAASRKFSLKLSLEINAKHFKEISQRWSRYWRRDVWLDGFLSFHFTARSSLTPKSIRMQKKEKRWKHRLSATRITEHRNHRTDGKFTALSELGDR